MPARLDPQLALDERAVNDPELEAALERHLRARDDMAEARQVVKAARKDIEAELEKHGHFPPESAIRCGRFRITKRLIEARHVEFDSAEREQLAFILVDDGAPAPRPRGRTKPRASDDEDLRPKGEVNPDMLRRVAEEHSEPVPFHRRSAGQPTVTH